MERGKYYPSRRFFYIAIFIIFLHGYRPLAGTPCRRPISLRSIRPPNPGVSVLKSFLRCLILAPCLIACGADVSEKTAPPLHFDDVAQTEVGSDSPEKGECHVQPTRRIRVEEPSRFASYDLDTLGILTIEAKPSDMPHCLETAIRDGAEILSNAGNTLTVFYPTRFEAFIDSTREGIDADAVEGRWSDTLHAVIPGVSGQRVLVEPTRAAFLDAVRNNAPSFALQIETLPAHSSDPAAFADFSPSVLIGEYRTVFSRSKPRTTNVKLAASACDGVFLMPGAVFSYNKWVGERSLERGFQEAPVIEQGQLVEGLGGGACQVSSTIHAAALVAGLGILERSNHSLPSSYIPVGLDAVVSYPQLDLRLKNTLARPVVIRAHIEDNTLIAQVFSDAAPTAQVMFRHEIAEEIPYKETITVDPSLPPGTVRVKKRGKVGYKVLRGRIFIENGKERYEKMYADTYMSQPQQTFIAPDVVYPPPEE